MRLTVYLSFLLLLLGTWHTSSAANVFWTNASGGNWSTATNWSTGSVPSATDDVFIDLNGTYTVTLDVTTSINSLTLGGSSGKQVLFLNARDLSIAAASSVEKHGELIMNDAELQGTGSLVNKGEFEVRYRNVLGIPVTNDSLLEVNNHSNSSTAAFTNNSGAIVKIVIRNNGYAQIAYGSGMTNNGLVELYNVGFTSSNRYSNLNASANVVNNGRIHVYGNQGTRGLYFPLINNGVVDIEYNTTLQATLPHQNNGDINISQNRTLTVDGNGVFNHNNGADVAGLGKLYFYTASAHFVPRQLPPVVIEFFQSTFSCADTVTNSKRVRIGLQNVVSANLINGDTVEIISYGTNWTGGFHNPTGKVLEMPIKNNGYSQLTFTNGLVNDGLIKMFNVGATSSSRYSRLNASANVVNNGRIHVFGTYGTRGLNFPLINNGVVDIEYTTTLQANSPHQNNGDINISQNRTLTVDGNGVFNHNNGADVTGLGKLYFYTASAHFVPRQLPPVVIEFFQSTFSCADTVTNSKRVLIGLQNTVSANLINGDTVEIISYGTNWTGGFYNPAGKVLEMPIKNNGYAQLTFANGLVNDGLIKMFNVGATSSSRYSRLNASANVVNNGRIHVFGTYGTRGLNFPLINNGVVDIEYNTTLQANLPHQNNGDINISQNRTLTVDGSGVFNHNNGADVAGLGKLYFYTASAHFVPSQLPPVVMEFYQSTFSCNDTVSSTKRIRIGYLNTISANLINGDTVEVISYGTNWTGGFTNPEGTVLELINKNNAWISITFANAFTNKGKVEQYQIGSLSSSRYNRLFWSADTMKNEGTWYVGGTQGTRGISGTFLNNGTLELEYTLGHAGDFVQTAGGDFMPHIITSSRFGRLVTTGTAKLKGTLDIQREPSYVPALGGRFSILPHNARVDTFFTVLNRQISGNNAFDVKYEATEVVLQAGVDPCAGVASPSITANNSVVCYLDSVQLTATSGFNTYEWYRDGASLNVTNATYQAKQQGFYSVQVTDVNGCVLNSPTMPIGFSQATVNILGGDTIQVCQGTPSTLFAGIGYSSYTWSNGESTSAIQVSNAGTYSLIVQNSFGCFAYDTVYARVDPSPSATISVVGNTGLCIGETVTLNAGTADSYLWSTGETSQSITVGNAGNYSVTVSNTFGCQDLATPVTVTVTDPLNGFGISQAINYLPASTVNFSSSTNGTINTYAWDFGDGNTSTVASPAHSYTQPGFYDVELIVEDASGCSDTLSKTSFVEVWQVFPNTSRPTGRTQTVTGSSFYAPNSGCVAVESGNPSGGGSVLFTTNGGTTWTTSNPNTTSTLTQVYYVGGSTFISGSNGLLCVSTNNGQTWTPFNTGVNITFWRIWFGGVGSGWAVGGNG
ncbi:MAG: PKD domain-containing protein, partial [Bacteroidota bacterium]